MAATSNDDVSERGESTSLDDESSAEHVPSADIEVLSPVGYLSESDDDRTISQSIQVVQPPPSVAHGLREVDPDRHDPYATHDPSEAYGQSGVELERHARYATPGTSSVAYGLREAEPDRHDPYATHVPSRKRTAVGLGSPQPVTRPAAGYTLERAQAEPSPPEANASQANADDGSITVTAPVVARVGVGLPLTMPGSVRIREMAETLDETEVLTLVGSVAPDGASPSESAEAEELEDSVTTRAPAAVTNPRLPEDEGAEGAAPAFASSSAPNTTVGRTARIAPYTLPDGALVSSSSSTIGRTARIAPYTLPEGAIALLDPYETEESVTTRGPLVVDYGDDSVTTRAPVAQRPPEHFGDADAGIEDNSDGTTRRVLKKVRRTSADDGEIESITTEAPGHLTNMLRVIASSVPAPIEASEPPQNQTAVMPNAPVRPPRAPGPSPVAMSSGPYGSARAIVGVASGHAAGALAELREPSSDSGLRVARSDAPSAESVSVGMLMGAGNVASHGSLNIAAASESLRANVDAPPSAVVPRGASSRPVAIPSNRSIAVVPNGGLPARSGDVEVAAARQAPSGPSTSPLDASPLDAKKPRYGLLVGLVAALSFAIPAVLFLSLRREPEPLERPVSEVESDVVPRDDVSRPKGAKGAPSASNAAGRASAVGSSVGSVTSGPTKSPPPPRRR